MFKKSASDLVASSMYQILNSEEHARLFKKAYSEKTCKSCMKAEDECMCGDMSYAKDKHPFHKSESCEECGEDKDNCMCGDMGYVYDEDSSWADDSNHAAAPAMPAKPVAPAAPAKPAAPVAAPMAGGAKKASYSGVYSKFATDEIDIDHDIDIDSEEAQYHKMMNLASKFPGGHKSKPCLAVHAKFRGKQISGLNEVVNMISSADFLSESERKELISYIGGKDPYFDEKTPVAAYSALEDLITASAALDYANLGKASELALKLASLVSEAKKGKMSGKSSEKSSASASKKSSKKPAKKPMKGKKPASSASNSSSSSSSSSKSSKKMTMKERMEMLRNKKK